MSRTIAWSQRVEEVWTSPDGRDVEITAEHTVARMVKLTGRDGESEWLPVAEFEAEYTQACCDKCGVPLTMMRKMLVEEAERNTPPAPTRPAKSTKGSYCTKPCCATRHAPPTC